MKLDPVYFGIAMGVVMIFIVLIAILERRVAIYKARMRILETELHDKTALAAQYYAKMKSYEKMLSASVSINAACGSNPETCPESECRYPECTYKPR